MKDFPDNIFDVLRPRLEQIRGVSDVYDRELNETDKNGSVGLSLDNWEPIEYEIDGNLGGPSIAAYTVNIEHLTKFASREEGNITHRSVARSIRSMLYHDSQTTVPLRQLAFTREGRTERLMKWTVSQRFVSNNISGSFFFVSLTTVTFQTSS